MGHRGGPIQGDSDTLCGFMWVCVVRSCTTQALATPDANATIHTSNTKRATAARGNAYTIATSLC